MNKNDWAVLELYKILSPEERMSATRATIENSIRTLADTDDGFENIVFEVGCRKLAKKFIKEVTK